MKLLHTFEDLKKENLEIVYALGTFDGLHLGHQEVIKVAQKKAQEVQAKVVLVTFDAHPFAAIPNRTVPPYLCQILDKIKLLGFYKVDYVLLLAMTPELLAISAENFLASLLNAGKVYGFVTGNNFTFGTGRLGTPDLIRTVTAGQNIEVIDLDLKESDPEKEVISSTRIRNLIKSGKIEEANALLSRPYTFEGVVIKGDERGRILGFPTLNFMFPKEMVLPPDGVYVNRVKIGNKWYGGVGNIGDNPTFTNQYHRFEVHVFDFNEMIYGKTVRVEFLKFVRSEVKFTSLEALMSQMDKDKELALEFLKNYEI